MDIKNILYISFSHFTWTEKHRCKNYFMLLYFNKKKDSPCWPRQSKTISKIVGLQWKDPKWRPYRYILSQTRAHIMTINQHKCFTRAFCPQLIRNVRSRRRIDSSSIIARPVNLLWERSVKCYAKNSTYIYMYMTLSIIDMDFLYQFNLRLIAPLFTVSFREMFEKKGFKISKVSRSVIGWQNG